MTSDLAQLALPGLEITTVGARPSDLASLDADQIVDALAHLVQVDSTAQWLIGDLVAAHMVATDDPAETLAAISPLGFDHAAVSNAFTLAVAVPHDERRPGLTHAHHWEVRRLAPEDRGPLLDRAVAERWSVRRLRKEVSDAFDERNPALPSLERLPRPPETALRRALASSRLVMWAPGDATHPGGLSAATVVDYGRRADGRLRIVVDVDAELAPALDDGDVAA